MHPILSIMKPTKSLCPLVNVLEILGDKWTLVIIRDLFLGKKTFTEFMKSSEKIASNILSKRLDTLNRHGMLKSVKLPANKKTKIYYLTDKGIDLFPIVFEMMSWSMRNLDIDFGPFAYQYFKASQAVSSTKFIKKTQSAYLKSRQKFLSN